MSGGSRICRLFVLGVLTTATVAAVFVNSSPPLSRVSAQAAPTPLPFDQAAALVNLREQIKGRENEPAERVFKNIQTPFIRSINAGRMLAVMEIAYSRSLGVTCTHCHSPDKWEAEDKPQKQVARDMAAMMARINGELLKGVKNLRGPQPTINCTTCHRGEVKPALNIPPALMRNTWQTPNLNQTLKSLGSLSTNMGPESKGNNRKCEKLRSLSSSSL